MSILASDIKLLASKTMDDVAEGGGGPTSTEIVDGASNQIFPDISEVDRAGGVVNLRQVFMSVQTNDNDTLLGSNIIVAKPPEDPNVSITMFTTGAMYDERAEAQSRLEAYLAAGSQYNGYLFGNHIAGQRTISIVQQVGTDLPSTDETLLLSKNEASGNPTQQYVRVSTVAADTRTFYDNSTSPPTAYTRQIVSAGITDPLEADFPGYDVSQVGPKQSDVTTGTMLRETVVADAAEYYGVVAVTSAVSINDYSAQAESIYTHLVPSATQETPLADVRMNQQSVALVPASGSTVTRSFAGFAWNTTTSLFVGAPVQPGTLTISPSGFGAITDSGGKLMQSGSQVGTIDYGNGILALSTNIFAGGAPAMTATWKPAAEVTIVSQSTSMPVTAVSQRLTYVLTLKQIPTAGSLSASFRAQGRWYVLQDDGSGVLRGSDSSFGVGTISFTTGTLSLTLGALPDVGSEVIFEYAASAQASSADSSPVNSVTTDNATHFRKPILLARAITPGTLTLTWYDGVSRTAHDDSNGNLTGDATGAVNYTNGNIQFSPNTLPAVGTIVAVSLTDGTKTTGSIMAFSGGGSSWTGSFGTAVTARSFRMSVPVSYPVRQYPGVDVTVESLMQVFDQGDGKLYVSNVTNNLQVGTINYSTGGFSLAVTSTGFKSVQSVWTTTHALGEGSGEPTTVLTGSETRTLTLTILAAPSTPIAAPAWAWWTGTQSVSAFVEYGGAAGTTYSGNVTFDSVALPETTTVAYSTGTSTGVYGVGYITNFSLGADFYTISGNTTVTRNPAASTGTGDTAGTTGYITTSGGYTQFSVILTEWTPGVTSQASGIGAGRSSSVSGSDTTMLTDLAVFRTAVAPLKNGSFSVVGTLADATTFNATADSDGKIISGTAVSGSAPGTYGVFGTVDYTYGVVKLHFGRRVPDTWASDGTHTGILDLTDLGLTGVTYIQSTGVQADTLRYNASAYSSIPLDADLIGVNPVRLPSDGRVPIFRKGSYAVIGEDHLSSATVTTGQTVNTGHVRLSRVTVTGSDGVAITAGWTADLEAGTVTFSNVTGYHQPVTINARVEDMMLVSDAQISGLLTFTRAVTHAYSTAAFISSALVPGNLKSRVSLVFDQASWDGTTFSDTSGGAATGTYDDTNFPITVTNAGAATERFALQFQSTTGFRVIGEHLGVIASGTINTDCAPLNPVTGEPYFTIQAEGWGSGWAVGNILRINTVGALYPVWLIRTVQQGPETVLDDNTTILIRGDVDRV